MKREQLLKLMRKYNAVFIRHGRKHDIYENPRTHELTQVPRHPNINKYTLQKNGNITLEKCTLADMNVAWGAGAAQNRWGISPTEPPGLFYS